MTLSDEVKFGIEIEFAANYKLRGSFGDKIYWACGTDNSAHFVKGSSSLYGLELRNRRPFVKDQAPSVFEELKQIILFIKENKGRSHSSCGIHIHFSFSKDLENKVEIVKNIKNKCLKRWQACVKPEREQYCMGICEDDKYQPIREVSLSENHWELRLLNGTLNFRGILENFKAFCKILDSVENIN